MEIRRKDVKNLLNIRRLLVMINTQTQFKDKLCGIQHLVLSRYNTVTNVKMFPKYENYTVAFCGMDLLLTNRQSKLFTTADTMTTMTSSGFCLISLQFSRLHKVRASSPKEPPSNSLRTAETGLSRTRRPSVH